MRSPGGERDEKRRNMPVSQQPYLYLQPCPFSSRVALHRLFRSTGSSKKTKTILLTQAKYIYIRKYVDGIVDETKQVTNSTTSPLCTFQKCWRLAGDKRETLKLR